jgi:transposase
MGATGRPHRLLNSTNSDKNHPIGLVEQQDYRRRNLVKRLVGKQKQFRRVATRYDKLDAYYPAFVQIASVMVWLRSFGDGI